MGGRRFQRWVGCILCPLKQASKSETRSLSPDQPQFWTRLNRQIGTFTPIELVTDGAWSLVGMQVGTQPQRDHCSYTISLSQISYCLEKTRVSRRRLARAVIFPLLWFLRRSSFLNIFGAPSINAATHNHKPQFGSQHVITLMKCGKMEFRTQWVWRGVLHIAGIVL